MHIETEGAMRASLKGWIHIYSKEPAEPAGVAEGCLAASLWAAADPEREVQ